MAIKEEFGLSLFGFDVIVPVRTVTYNSDAQMGIGTRTGILESRSRSINHHHNGFSINGITSDTGTCQLKTMGLALNGSRSVMTDEEHREKDSMNSTNIIFEKNGEKEGEEKGFTKTEKEKKQGQGEGQGEGEGQGCQHLHTENRIESNQTSSKIPRNPVNLESLLPSDPRSSSMIHSAFPSKGIQDIQDIQQYSQVEFYKNLSLSCDKIITNSENKEEEIRINEEKDEDDFGKDKEKDRSDDKTDDEFDIKVGEVKRDRKEKEEEEEEEGEEEDGSELVVIDVNYFPSYKEVPDFPHRLRKFLRQKAGMALYSTVQN